MKRSKAILTVAAALLGLGLGGCQWTTPYVYKYEEFDRDSVDFGKQITDRDSVQICYNSRGTTPAAIARMAKDECARFGKIARFQSNGYLECPLLTPVQATFSCDTPR